METILRFLIYVHIAAGSVALISGPLSIASLKGGRLHRLSGKLFFFAMMLVALSAVIVACSPAHSNLFLFIIGIFSAYLVSSGYRALYLKKLYKDQQPGLIDWVITLVMAAFAVYFLYLGAAALAAGNSKGLVLLVLGSISFLMVRSDLVHYIRRPASKNFWLYQHISRMIAGNIAAFTAFLVVNNTYLPNLAAWLLPAVIGTPIISYYTRLYRSKTRNDKPLTELTSLRIRDQNS